MANRETNLNIVLFLFNLSDRIQAFFKLFTTRFFLIGFSIFMFTSVTMIAVYGYQLMYTANFQVGKKDVYLYIPKDADFQTVLDSLRQNEIVHDALSFAFLSKLLNYQDNVKSGRYLIQSDMNNNQVVYMLRSGNQVPVDVTFNNVRLKRDLTKKIVKNLSFKEEELLREINNPETALKYGFDTTTIVCMFLPNTYQVYWTIQPDKFLDKMHETYKEFWNEERLEKAKKINLTTTQVSILASIVQAETIKNDEKPRVAGAYINRLQKGMLLQADPTVVFGLQDFGIKRLLNKHLEVDTPYNTYKYKGLPPGPINLPTVSSIDAVLNYEKHEYIFFCAKEDFSGYHNFAKTLAEHSANARNYQNALNKKKIYE